MNLIPQDSTGQHYKKPDSLTQVVTDNDSFSGITGLVPSKKETNSSPMAAPSDTKILDFYPSLQVEKVLDEDSPKQGNHSFNEQEYGDEDDAVLLADSSKVAESIGDLAKENNFLEDEDDDMNDIKKALV